MSVKKYDTVVVGGGMAGLTASAFLAKEGQKVLLIEKNEEVGGLVSTISVDGFRFEAGIRALENAGIIFPMLKALGVELEVVRSRVSVGVEDQILNIDDLSGLKDYENMLINLYPENEQEIQTIMKIVRKIMKHMDVLYGVDNPVFKDLKNDRAYIFKELLPWLPKFILTVRRIHRMNMPVEDYLRTISSNQSLVDIISQHFFRNTPTFFALSYFSLYLDYFYPMGGVGKLAETVEGKLRSLGGEIITDTSVVQVDAGKQLVTDEHGARYQYDNLIWAADLKTLYKNTFTEGLPTKVETNFSKAKGRMLENRGGDSVFGLYLELDEPLETFRKIAHGHFFYTPSRQGLGKIHRQELNGMLENWSQVTKAQLSEWLDRFTRLNTYEISIPGLKDPTMVPSGKTGMIVSFLTEYDIFDRAEKNGWYPEFRKELEDRMIQVLTDSVYPGLKEKVIKQFSFTPLSIKNRIASSEGAIVGWSFENPIPVPNKMQHADKATRTPIPNIFKAGQWSFSPAGVPIAILTGKFAADRVLKKSKHKKH